MSGAAYAADGQPVDRAAFYAIACDPSRSVVVEACAGAGKTWMLVSRILRALLDGAQPQQGLVPAAAAGTTAGASGAGAGAEGQPLHVVRTWGYQLSVPLTLI